MNRIAKTGLGIILSAGFLGIGSYGAVKYDEYWNNLPSSKLSQKAYSIAPTGNYESDVASVSYKLEDGSSVNVKTQDRRLTLTLDYRIIFPSTHNTSKLEKQFIPSNSGLVELREGQIKNYGFWQSRYEELIHKVGDAREKIISSVQPVESAN